MRYLFHLIGFIVLTMFLSACDNSKPHPPLPRNATVLALGDSLTYGYGTTLDRAYPQRLAHTTGWQVINAGINGNTSTEALQRLPELLKIHRPNLVIVSIGGNDFLQRLSTQQTETNIRGIIQSIRANSNARILLIGIPYLSIGAALGSPKDHPLYQDIADSEHVPLLSNAWAEVIGDAALRADQVHPNAAGYEQFTQTLVTFLQKQGWFIPD